MQKRKAKVQAMVIEETWRPGFSPRIKNGKFVNKPAEQPQRSGTTHTDSYRMRKIEKKSAENSNEN